MNKSTLNTWKKLQEEGYFEKHPLYDCKSIGIPHCTEMADIQSKNVLDFGCGYGRDSFLFSMWANTVYAVDVSKSILDKTRKFLISQKNVEYYLTENIEEIPDNSIDYIYALHVFQHLSPEQAIEYISIFKQKLKLNGQMMIQFYLGTDKMVDDNKEPRVQYTMAEIQILFKEFKVNSIWALQKFTKEENLQYTHYYIKVRKA